jgi:hypothetical protein
MLLSACSSSSPSPVASSPAPTGQASADLKLNAQKSGTFNCSGGLFFVTSVLNQTTAPLRVDALNLTFTKVSGSACSNNMAAIDPQVGMSIPQGVSTEIRRVDLAGPLCSAPTGAPGCDWLGKATLTTSFGTLTDEIPFRTVGTAAEVIPPPAPAHITDFSWRNETVTLACDNLLTGADFASIHCSADAAAPVRIRIADVSGNCRQGSFPYGKRCDTIDATQTVTANWEAPYDFGSTSTAITVLVTCEVLDSHGQAIDSRSTCIPSIGYENQHAIQPPWPDYCQAEIIGCHGRP